MHWGERRTTGLIKTISFRRFAGWFVLNACLLTSLSTLGFHCLFCFLGKLPVLKVLAL